MLNAQFRPLDKWPGERTKFRKDAQFRAKYPQTLDLLEYELAKLRAGNTIIQIDNLTTADIRNDGWPKGSWCPRGGWQGVVVSFDSPKGAGEFHAVHRLVSLTKTAEALRSCARTIQENRLDSVKAVAC